MTRKIPLLACLSGKPPVGMELNPRRRSRMHVLSEDAMKVAGYFVFLALLGHALVALISTGWLGMSLETPKQERDFFLGVFTGGLICLPWLPLSWKRLRDTENHDAMFLTARNEFRLSAPVRHLPELRARMRSEKFGGHLDVFCVTLQDFQARSLPPNPKATYLIASIEEACGKMLSDNLLLNDPEAKADLAVILDKANSFLRNCTQKSYLSMKDDFQNDLRILGSQMGFED